MLFGSSQLIGQSAYQNVPLDRIPKTTDQMPWRNAAERNDHARRSSNAWNVNHDSNSVRDTIDGYITNSSEIDAIAIFRKSRLIRLCVVEYRTNPQG